MEFVTLITISEIIITSPWSWLKTDVIFFSCESDSRIASVCPSVSLSQKTLSLSESLLLTINHQANQPLSLSTIKPINHQAYQPLSLLTIEPINHLAY